MIAFCLCILFCAYTTIEACAERHPVRTRKTRAHRTCQYDTSAQTLFHLAIEIIMSSYETQHDQSHDRSVHRANMRKPDIEILERIAIQHNNIDAQYALFALYKNLIIDQPQDPRAAAYYLNFESDQLSYESWLELEKQITTIKRSERSIRERLAKQTREESAFFAMMQAYKS